MAVREHVGRDESDNNNDDDDDDDERYGRDIQEERMSGRKEPCIKD